MTESEAREALAGWRRQIDAVDLRILELLNERTRVVQEIGRVKQSANLPVYEPKREGQVFLNVTENNPGPMPNDAVKRIFERIVDEMRGIQRMRMEGSK